VREEKLLISVSSCLKYKKILKEKLVHSMTPMRSPPPFSFPFLLFITPRLSHDHQYLLPSPPPSEKPVSFPCLSLSHLRLNSFSCFYGHLLKFIQLPLSPLPSPPAYLVFLPISNPKEQCDFTKIKGKCSVRVRLHPSSINRISLELCHFSQAIYTQVLNGQASNKSRKALCLAFVTPSTRPSYS